MGGKKTMHAGWWYSFGIHMGISRGEVDALKEIRIGDRRAWVGNLLTNGTIQIEAATLFGGEEKEGGVQGPLEVMFGGPTQVASAGLQAMLGPVLPGFRGMFTAFFNGRISANNPYPKPWKFRLSRIFKGWDGDVIAPSLARIPLEGLEVEGREVILDFPFTVDDASQGSAVVSYPLGMPTNADAYNADGVLMGISTTDRDEFGYAAYIPTIDFTYTNAAGNGSLAGFRELVYEIECSGLDTVGPPAPISGVNYLFTLSRVLFYFGETFSGGFFNSLETYVRYLYHAGQYQWQFFIAVNVTPVVSIPLGQLSSVRFRVVVSNFAREARFYVNNVLVHSRATPAAGGSWPCQRIDHEDVGSFLEQDDADAFNYKIQARVKNLKFYGTQSYGLDSMNGAHIIYEVLTNREWGRGLPRTQVDEASFVLAADRLYTEGFGLCAKWTRQGSIEDFVQQILDHIGASLYEDRKTGLMKLSLIRDDYLDIGADPVPFFTPETGLLEVRNYTVSSIGRGVNAISVKWHDQLEDEDRSVTVKNAAAIQVAQGSVNSAEKSYLFLPTPVLALRVAQRDLRAASTNLRRATLVIDGNAPGADDVFPGSVIEIQDVNRAIPRMYMRVGTAEFGNDTDEQLIVEAVQDVFALPSQSFAVDTPSNWTPPNTKPCIAEQRIFEIPYFLLAGRMPPSDFAYVDENGGYLGVVSSKGKTTNAGIQVAVRNGASTPDDQPLDDSYFCE